MIKNSGKHEVSSNESTGEIESVDSEADDEPEVQVVRTQRTMLGKRAITDRTIDSLGLFNRPQPVKKRVQDFKIPVGKPAKAKKVKPSLPRSGLTACGKYEFQSNKTGQATLKPLAAIDYLNSIKDNEYETFSDL